MHDLWQQLKQAYFLEASFFTSPVAIVVAGILAGTILYSLRKLQPPSIGAAKQEKGRADMSMAADDVDRDIRVAALCGSLRAASFNRGLIRSAVKLCEEFVPGMAMDLVDIVELPFVNTDLEVEGKYPAVVEDFRRRIKEADCILFATPEYNYSLPAVLKNAVDWGSRPPNVWADKAAAIISAAGGSGGSRGQYHLRQVGVFLDLHFINKPELFVVAKQPQNKFDKDGNLVDPEIKERLKQLLLSLQAWSLRLRVPIIQ